MNYYYIKELKIDVTEKVLITNLTEIATILKNNVKIIINKEKDQKQVLKNIDNFVDECKKMKESGITRFRMGARYGFEESNWFVGLFKTIYYAFKFVLSPTVQNLLLKKAADANLSKLEGKINDKIKPKPKMSN